MNMDAAPLILTVGHSTRSLEELIALLRANNVAHLADVRTVPRSRRHPHFSRELLPAPLGEAGVRYTHHPALGGLRKPRPASPNGALENDSFRGYADHMGTAAFAEGVEGLLALGAALPPGQHLAVMCAEAVPWRCHRSLLADALAARGVAVEHVLDRGPRRPHELSPLGRVTGGRVTYPPAQGALPF